MLKDNNLCVIV